MAIYVRERRAVSAVGRLVGRVRHLTTDTNARMITVSMRMGKNTIFELRPSSHW
jgi:hypothetical protein